MSTTTELMTTLTRTCPMCSTITAAEVPQRVITARMNGVLIQDAWPEASTDEREFIQTGYCPSCMLALFGSADEEEQP